jgi:hypothetical protein
LRSDDGLISLRCTNFGNALLDPLLILDAKRTTKAAETALATVEPVLLLRSPSAARPIATSGSIPLGSKKTTTDSNTAIKPNKINILFAPTSYSATNTRNGDAEESLDLLHFQ